MNIINGESVYTHYPGVRNNEKPTRKLSRASILCKGNIDIAGTTRRDDKNKLGFGKYLLKRRPSMAGRRYGNTNTDVHVSGAYMHVRQRPTSAGV